MKGIQMWRSCHLLLPSGRYYAKHDKLGSDIIFSGPFDVNDEFLKRANVTFPALMEKGRETGKPGTVFRHHGIEKDIEFKKILNE